MCKKKVLVIGWDAADWKVIMPLVAQGKMPTLAKFISEGVHGDFKTLDPPLSPMLWTSMATGFRADKHGIKGFIEPTEDGSGVRAVQVTSRKTKAIWNILQHEGLKSNVVAWWPTNPAEPISGIMVSNHYQAFSKPINEPWPMPPGTVHPESMADTLKRFRVHSGEITEAHLLPFVPDLEQVDIEKDERVRHLAKILAHASSVHAASTYLQRETEWDFMAVYHDAIDHFCHLAMKFHPPYREGAPRDLFERYKGVVEAGYLFHDMMLETTLSMVDDDTTVILVSDHGFHSDHLRPTVLPKEPAAPAREHSPYGIFVAKGPGIKKGERIFGASVIDLTPTILSIYDLPIGEDMEGKPLTQIFTEPREIKKIPSWEAVEGECGMHKEDAGVDPWANQQAMQQLVDLGYVEAPDEDTAAQVKRCVNESDFYVARNLLDAGKLKEGISLLEELHARDPQAIRYGQRLAFTCLTARKYARCRELIAELRVLEEEKTKREIEEYRQEKLEKEKITDPVIPDHLKKEPLYLDFLEGTLLLALNRPVKAYEKLKDLEKKAPNVPEVHFNIAKVALTRQRWSEAEENYIKALARDADNYRAHHGLGLTYMRTGRYEMAVEEFLTALEKNYVYPVCHYHLGEALVRMNRPQEATQAFEVAISMQPGMTKAHKWLSKLYREELNMEKRALAHDQFIMNNIKGEVVIVSGLPRSGTSMMMQMLHSGGMEVLTDAKREADDSNPKGYYEFEPVKKMMADVSWLPEANGKVVKIIAQLLTFLPDNYKYKIVFMRREMDEVLTSQQVMIGKTKEVAVHGYSLRHTVPIKKQITNGLNSLL